MARVADASSEASGLVADDDGEFAADEIRAALCLTRRAAMLLLELAWELQRLPQLAAALRSGLIDLPRARVVCTEVATLDDEEAQGVVSAVSGAGAYPDHRSAGGAGAPPGPLLGPHLSQGTLRTGDRGSEGGAVGQPRRHRQPHRLLAPRRPGQRRLPPSRPPRPSGQGSRRPPQHRPGASRRPLGPGGRRHRLHPAAGSSTSESTWPPSPSCRRIRGRYRLRAGDRRRRPPGGRHPGGVAVAGHRHPPRQRSRAVERDHQDGDPTTPNAAMWKPGLPPVSSPGAACPPPAPTWTTGSTTPREDPPWSKTSTRCAATTTGSKTPDGNCNPDPTAPPPGPVPSDTPTPPDPTHPERGVTRGAVILRSSNPPWLPGPGISRSVRLEACQPAQ